ncbi:MAG: class I SAM-dependent methyltransferase [Vulcanimicrobiota bacterium]
MSIDTTILKHRKLWNKKGSLRLIYNEEIYKRIDENLISGPTLEIGSGPGFYKKNHEKIVSSDILFSNELDVVCNSHFLPFKDKAFMNIVGVDVLHHFDKPSAFFDECLRILEPNGRLILIEPWISPLSKIVYSYFHHEECKLTKDVLDKPFEDEKTAWDGNSMIPFQIFSQKNNERFIHRWPNLRISVIKPFSPFCYLLTGGFQPYGIYSEKIMSLLLKIEHIFEPFLIPLMTFRVLIVLERV